MRIPNSDNALVNKERFLIWSTETVRELFEDSMLGITPR